MGNSYFKFKQFTIEQNLCAMKVCTDACLFGAVTNNVFAEGKDNLRLLDIGTGTGLLSLMYAQHNATAIIDAVEIDEAAAQQATENFANSAWGGRLTVHHASIQQFTKTRQQTNQSFNLIISNPPFFENDLKSDDHKRNIALHSDALSLEELLSCIIGLLSDDGIFGVLLPYHRSAFFERLAVEKGFYLAKKVSVKQTPRHNYFRSILFFGRNAGEVVQEEIIIKNEFNDYTTAFTALLKDYYLYL